jgi:hypothetical protein
MRVMLDRLGIAALARDPEMVNYMLMVAELCQAKAEATAPVRYGTYKKSMFAAKLRTHNGAFYGSSDVKAMLMEYGSKNNKAFHTLRNAAIAYRLKVIEMRRR